MAGPHAPAADGPDGPAEREIRRLLDELAAAHLHNDEAAFDRLRAADYVFTTADGRFLDKA